MAAYSQSALSKTVTQNPAMEVVVLHTNIADTLKALRTAATLAHGLSARIRLLVLEVVPYPLPLDRPNVPLPFTRKRFRTLAADAAVETIVDIQLVRDANHEMESILEPGSVVVLGARREWWPSAQQRMARRLEHAGHQVVYGA